MWAFLRQVLRRPHAGKPDTQRAIKDFREQAAASRAATRRMQGIFDDIVMPEPRRQERPK